MTVYIDYPVVAQAAKDFAKRQEQLTATLDTLETGLAPMLGSWEGSARDLYVEKKAAWDKAAADLGALLTAIAQHTQNAHDGFAEVVTKNKSAWES